MVKFKREWPPLLWANTPLTTPSYLPAPTIYRLMVIFYYGRLKVSPPPPVDGLTFSGLAAGEGAALPHGKPNNRIMERHLHHHHTVRYATTKDCPIGGGGGGQPECETVEPFCFTCGAAPTTEMESNSIFLPLNSMKGCCSGDEWSSATDTVHCLFFRSVSLGRLLGNNRCD